jgi:hypothetical protein
MLKSIVKWTLLPAAAAVLVACGGGGGGPMATAITGTAATGAPMANAPVFIKDASGKEPEGQNEANGVSVVTTDSNGDFSISPSVLSGLRAPMIVRTTGKVVLDSGDDAVVTLHSLIGSPQTSTLNITPLTEAATLLATGQASNQAFNNPTSALTQVSATSLQTTNQSLVSALGSAAPSQLNVFTSSLDARQNADLSNPSSAKAHDLLLDSLAMSYTQGNVVLADRNRPADELDSAPRVVISAGQTPAVAGGALPGATPAGFLSSDQLEQLTTRFTQQFAAGAGCTIPLTGNYNSTCSAVLSSVSGIFSPQFKNEGISALSWLRQWVATPLDTEDLSGLTVTVSVPYRGSYVIAGTNTRVTRVILKFQNTNGDFVRRPILLTQSGNNVVAYGDQKDYLAWIRPRVSVSADADDTYPYYPKFEAGLNLIVKNHYAGFRGIVMGAHISGPGLPTGRSTDREKFPTEVQNRNGITEGVELFDNTAQGCSNLSIDPSVYVSQNQMSWSDAWTAYRESGYSESGRQTLYSGIIRFRASQSTCAPMFDFRRYYGGSNQTFTLPKKGDSYSVVLYLNKANFDNAELTLPIGATEATVKDLNDRNVEIYKLPVQVKLAADALDIPSTIPANSLPGITDSTRQALLSADIGSDRTVSWTRNRIYWPEKDGQGQVINTPFVNFSAGIFQSAYDQYRTVDSYSGATVGGYKKYSEYFTGTDIRSACGQTVGEHQGGDVVVYIQKRTRTSTAEAWPNTGTTVNCPSDLLTNTTRDGNTWRFIQNGSSDRIAYQMYVARSRVKYQVDRSTLVTENQTSRTLTWNFLINKEAQGSEALCSSFAGYWPYRQAYVHMIDINGRMIGERREVYGDYPDLAPSLMGESTSPSNPELYRAIEVSRPRMNNDALYIPFVINTVGFESVANFNIGKRGIIHAAKMRSDNACTQSDW